MKPALNRPRNAQSSPKPPRDRLRGTVEGVVLACMIGMLGSLLGTGFQRQADFDETTKLSSSSRRSSTDEKSAEPEAETAGKPADRRNGTSTTQARRPEPARTSWQDPFRASYWESRHWSFHGESMVSAGSRAEATFFRPYRKLMVDAEVEPLRRESGTLEIRLTCQEPYARTTVVFSRRRVEVWAETNRQRGLIREEQVDVGFRPGQTVRLFFAATGNRLVIANGNRPILTCSQPARQSGNRFALTLAAPEAAIRISRLRIEGD